MRSLQQRRKEGKLPSSKKKTIGREDRRDEGFNLSAKGFKGKKETRYLQKKETRGRMRVG